MHPVQIDGYRRMTPTEKLERLAAFQRAGREMLKCGISAQHPEWTDAEIEREIRERMLYGVS